MALFQGIKVKMTAALIFAVLGTAVALTAITYFLGSYTLEVSLRSRAQETAKILNEALSGRAHQLEIRTEVISVDNDFQTAYAFRQDELARLTKDLGERVERAGATLGLVADLDGKVATVAQTKAGDGIDANLLASSVALADARKNATSATAIERLKDRVFFVAAVPIKRYGEQTLGYLTMANVFDDRLVSQLKEASGADVLLVFDGAPRLGTTTLEGGQAGLSGLDQRLGKDLVPVKGLVAKGGDPLFANAMALRAGTRTQAALVFALAARDVNALQSRVLRASIGLALVITLLAGLIGLFIARRISDPIVEIEQGFREIAASGDLSRRITKSYSDEVGRMADSFNQMQNQIEGLYARVVAAEQRMRDELKMAAVVQEMLVPTAAVDGARCRFASHSQTSTETGGDWFSIIHAPERNLTTAVIADVTGHGAPAALVTAILHGFFRAKQDEIAHTSQADWQPTIDRILHQLNETVIDATHRSLTTSLLLLTFDHSTLEARYANCGHLAPLIVQPGKVKGQSQVGFVSCPPSPLIGSIDEPQFSWGELKLAPEQILLLYTDGLIECTNAAQEQYGLRRLRRILGDIGHLDARAVRDTLLQDALTFYGDMPRADDITLVVARVR